jgi:glycerophosphoryl diester phosphodiesterase
MRKNLSLLVGVVLLASAVAVPGVGAAGDDGVWSERRVLNVAHAGGDLEAPHSTLFAMKTAVAAGTDVLEMDVRLSADGVLMVHHDETVDRTTEATGTMASFTAVELQALDNAYWFVPNCWSCHDRPAEEYALRGIRSGAQPPPDGFSASDFAIPTLAEVVATFPDRVLDVEIKEGGTAAAEALADFIAANGPVDRYLVASFDDDVLAHFKTLAPNVATSPGLGTMTAWFATRGPLPDHQVLQVPPSFSGIEVVTQQFVDDAHANGLAVWVWFNGTDDDSEAVWQHLIDIGVDALLTGKPLAAQKVIDANDAGFAAAPALDPVAGVHGRTASVGVECPVLHVATCASRMAIIARRADGRWVVASITDLEVVRGTHEVVPVDLLRDGRRLLRSHPVTAFAWLFPLDGDTAPTITPIELTRR